MTNPEEKLLTGPEAQSFLPEDNLPKLSAKEFLIKTSASELKNIFGIETSTPPFSNNVATSKNHVVSQPAESSNLPNLKSKNINGVFPKKINRFSIFKLLATLTLLALIILDFLYIWGALIQ